MSHYAPSLSFGGSYPPTDESHYAYPQHGLRGYTSHQSQPSDNVSVQNMNAYVHAVNAQNGARNASATMENPSPFADLAGSPQYDPQIPAMYPVIPNVSSGSPFPASAHAPAFASSRHAQHQNSQVETMIPQQRPQESTYQKEDASPNGPARSESELEDGELSSRAMSEGEEPMKTLNTPDHLQGVSYNAIKNIPFGVDDLDAAQNLVRELHSWGLSFRDIAAEVTDGQALQHLFEEIGLPLNGTMAGGKTLQSLQPLKAAVEVQGRPKPGNAEIQNANIQDSGRLFPSKVGAVATHLGSKRLENAIDFVNGAKPLDRKALIAQKLAAKNVRSTSSPSVLPPVLEPITLEAPSIDNVAPLLKAPSSVLSTTHSIGSPFHSQTDSLSAAQAKDERKRKTNAELARQKLEALRQKATVKHVSPVQNLEESSKGQSPCNRSVASDVSRNTEPVVDPTRIAVSDTPRKGSYFSSVSQNATFTIPGLFSSLRPVPNGLLPDIVHNTSEPDVDVQVSQSNTAKSSLVAPTGQRRPSTSPVPTNIAVDDGAVLISKKRQRASDFLDSPPRGLKRPLTQRDVGVIIDISDEGSSPSDVDQYGTINITDASNLGIDKAGSSNSQMAQSSNPVVDSIPSADGMQLEVAIPRSQEPPELKTKEQEIQVMNKKIAELEANIKARKSKQAVSNIHLPSPGSSAQFTATQTPVEVPSTNSNALTVQAATSFAKPDLGVSVSEDVNMSHDVTIEGVNNQTGSLPGNHEIDGTDIDVLINHSTQSPESEEGEIHDGQSPSLRSPVPHLRTQQEASEVSESIIIRQQSRRAEIESGLPVLEEEISRTRERLQLLREQEAELEIEIQKGLEGRQMLLNELKRLSRAVETLQVDPNSDIVLQDDPLRQASPALQRPRIDLKSSVEDADVIQGLSRNSSQIFQISDDLPGNAVSKSLSPHIRSSFSMDNGDRFNHEEGEEDGMDISRSDLDDGEVDEGEHVDDFVDIEYGEADNQLNDDGHDYAQDERDTAEDRLVTQDEDSSHTSKISHYEIEGQPNHEAVSTEAFARSPDADALDDEKVYEPPNEIFEVNNPPYSEPTAMAEQKNQASIALSALSEEIGDDIDSDSLFNSDGSGVVRPSSTGQDESDKQVVGHTAAQSLDISCGDHSDEDYEPPEPTAPSDDPSGAAATSNAHQPDASDISNGSVSHDGPHDDQRNGHFVPYQSPLKQLKSYRYHPEYVDSTSAGYRSLTYSHAIHPENPICHYELSGSCNDPHCRAQHFASMGVSDDVILRELATPKGIAEQDQPAFITGLKGLIMHLRNRKTNGMTDIASAIAKYRKDFLGDNSWVFS